MFYVPFAPRPAASPPWSSLTLEDQNEFFRIRSELHESQNTPQKDKRAILFPAELSLVLYFTERSPAGVEDRSIAVGAAFAGPFICVNTSQFKSFLGRCKSSVNGCFHQMGYVALRTKSKARECILSCLPSLAHDPSALRRWTVRCPSDDSPVCFFSRYINLALTPKISASDLCIDRKSPAEQSQINPLPIPITEPRVSFAPRQIDFDLYDLDLDDECITSVHEFATSVSMDYMAALEEADVTESLPRYEMHRSRSVW